MYWKSLIAPTIFGAYFIITGAAFVYTMSRLKIPFLPWPMVHASFMLIAPYQGDVSWNGTWIAEGQLPDGSWVSVPFESYFPAIRGEASVRMALRSFERKENSDLLYAKYRELALLLLERERAKGNLFDHMRLFYRTWPRSPEGYDALYKDPFLLHNEIVTLVP